MRFFFIVCLFVFCISAGLQSCNKNSTEKTKESVKIEFEEKEGLFYVKGSEIPFSGKIESFYENKSKKREMSIINGKPHGKMTDYYENGKKKSETYFTNGVLNGKKTIWDEKGKVTSEETYIDGKKKLSFIEKKINAAATNMALIYLKEKGEELTKEKIELGQKVIYEELLNNYKKGEASEISLNCVINAKTVKEITDCDKIDEIKEK